MNRPVLRLFAVVLVLFGALIGMTTWNTVLGAKGLRDNPDNKRALLQEAEIRRGRILADDGTVLARSRKGPSGIYRRTYPTAALFGHPVGYAFLQLGRSGLEQARDEELSGRGRPGVSVVLDQLRGRRRQGNDVVTSLDPQAQQVAVDQLAGRKGSVVALDPASGQIKVMVSVPGFDPNQVPQQFGPLNSPASGAALLNRATQAGYPPGSTFKVVTAAAAIDSGRFTAGSVVNGNSPITVSGVPLANDGGASYGPIDLTKALTYSVNTVWAQVALRLGRATMARYMNRFGFDRKPELDYPAVQVAASGEFAPTGRLLSPLSPRVDLGRMAIGQDKLRVTPLQMAEVAATIANGGVRMKPRLTQKIVDPDGRTVRDFSPEVAARVVSPQTARQVTQMMTQVVSDPEGTGNAARIADTVVAGKTGTAERDRAQNINQVWFIAFAPADKPRVAIAVTIEQSSGFGGTVAAPIAKAVMEKLLQ